MTATEGLLRRHGPLDTLDARRELMIAHLADWTEVLDPCAAGHTEHGPDAHRGRRLVRAIPSGFTYSPTVDWLYDDAVAFIKDARTIGAALESRIAARVAVLGADDRLMFFEVRPQRASVLDDRDGPSYFEDVP